MFFKRKPPAPTPAPTPADTSVVETPQMDTPHLATQTAEDIQIVKLVEEVAEITKRAVPSETVTVDTITETELEPYSIDLRRENYRVERIAKDEVVTTIPSIRKENDVTIIPVLEERLVTIKQIVLREEIHLHPEHSVETERGEIELRKQRAVIDRKTLV